MEDDAAMSRSASEGSNYCEEVRRLENEDAVRARDILSQYFLTTMSSESEAGPGNPEEDHEVVATSLRDENNVEKEQITSERDNARCIFLLHSRAPVDEIIISDSLDLAPCQSRLLRHL